MPENKSFVPSFFIREKQGQYGPFLTIGVGPEAVEWLRQHADERGFTNVVVSKKREVKGERATTHYAYLDTYKPKAQRELSDEPPF